MSTKEIGVKCLPIKYIGVFSQLEEGTCEQCGDPNVIHLHSVVERRYIVSEYGEIFELIHDSDVFRIKQIKVYEQKYEAKE